MSSHPLFTDVTLPLSVTLAATIGLEDALLLTVLNQAASMQPNSERDGICLTRNSVRQNLPFWDDVTIRRTLASLIDKGLVSLVGPMYPEAPTLTLRFPEHTAAAPATEHHQNSHPQTSHSMASRSMTNASAEASAPVSHAGTYASAGSPTTSPATGHQQPVAQAASMPARHQPLASDWQPGPDTLQRLQQHGIPHSFVWAQRDTFLLEGQERGANRNDWNTRFFRFVKAAWVHSQNAAQRQNRHEQWRDGSAFQVTQDEAVPIEGNWQPSEDAIRILHNAGVDPAFIQDAVPEFVLYWRERGDALKTWNSKFIQHIRQQWARYSQSMQHSNLPTPIDPNWQPSDDCYDILNMAHIDPEFARQQVAEFVLYWRDSGQVHSSWNSRFLQYIKQQWARRLAQTGDNHGTASHASAAQPGYSTAEASVQRLNDTSW